jgi:hypothetical protein
MNDSSKETPAIKKPSRLRQAIPWALAAAILVYMFWKVDFGKVLAALEHARASWIIAAYLAYCAVYYLTDILSFYRVYNWFNVSIGLAETGRLRFASYAVQAVNGALTEVMCLLYMFRAKKVQVLHATSSMGFVYFNETLTLILFLTWCAFTLPPENRILLTVPLLNLPFWTLFQALLIFLWCLLPVWLAFWRTGLKDRFPRLRDNGALMAFREATLANYGEVFLYRFVNNLISLGANIVMLKALGINAPASLLFGVVPLMVNIAYWPVSVGGFGGPQLVADFLLKGYASREEVLAYSLVWSALFFLTRTFTGLLFLKPVYAQAFPSEKK